MSESYWRDKASPIIQRIIAATPKGEDEVSWKKEVRRKLRLAYPFGLRQYHPYKIWCDEVRRQLGEKPARNGKRTPAAQVQAENPNQERLFR